MSNQIQKVPFSAMLQKPAYQKALQNALTDKKEIQKFTSAITSVVANNPQIAECDNGTILSAALLGHSLGLVPSPQLGQYYMVPFKDRNNNRTTATFVLGYKGYVQLAIRSGAYKRLNVVEIKEGELKYFDRLTEEYDLNFIDDDTEREATPTVGYLAYFKYVTGYEKAIYWSKEKMKSHAIEYSKGYKSDIKNGTKYTFWSKDFDAMAKKTMLRQLIGKWGTMSVEMQQAYIADGAEVDNSGNPINYAESDYIEVPHAESEPAPVQGEVIQAPEVENQSTSSQSAFSLKDFE